jgi:hypothetical protein
LLEGARRARENISSSSALEIVTPSTKFIADLRAWTKSEKVLISNASVSLCIS